MNSIELQQTLPAVFAGRDFIVSDVWHQSLQLKRGEAYHFAATYMDIETTIRGLSVLTVRIFVISL